MVCPLPTCRTFRSTASSPPVTCARVTTRMVAATDCQSAKLGDSGSNAGSASMRDGSTNRNRPSKRRSRRRTSVTVRQATRLASSPARGRHAGTARRSACGSRMSICGTAGAWPWPRAAASPARVSVAARTAAVLRPRVEDGADRESVRSITPGERREGRGRVDRPLGGGVEDGHAAAFDHAHVLERPRLRDGEAHGDGLGESRLDLPRPDQPDLPLHARKVPVTARVVAPGNAEPRRALDVEAGDAGVGGATPRCRRGRGRGSSLLRRRARLFAVERRQALAPLLLRRFQELRRRPRLRDGRGWRGGGRGCGRGLGPGLGSARTAAAAWKRYREARDLAYPRAARAQPGDEQRHAEDRDVTEGRDGEGRPEAAI